MTRRRGAEGGSFWTARSVRARAGVDACIRGGTAADGGQDVRQGGAEARRGGDVGVCQEEERRRLEQSAGIGEDAGAVCHGRLVGGVAGRVRARRGLAGVAAQRVRPGRVAARGPARLDGRPAWPDDGTWSDTGYLGCSLAAASAGREVTPVKSPAGRSRGGRIRVGRCRRRVGSRSARRETRGRCRCLRDCRGWTRAAEMRARFVEAAGRLPAGSNSWSGLPGRPGASARREDS